MKAVKWNRLFFILVLGLCLVGTACGQAAPQVLPPADNPEVESPQPSPTPSLAGEEIEKALYQDPSQPVDARVEDLLSRMTLEEKLGQMAQVEKNSLPADDAGKYFIGSVLSGGGGSPEPNDAGNWVKMVDGFQASALSTRLGIPMLYGVDAVHGHNNLNGATIFPHNIGLGAANDPDLMEQIGRGYSRRDGRYRCAVEFWTGASLSCRISAGGAPMKATAKTPPWSLRWRQPILGMQETGSGAGLSDPLWRPLARPSTTSAMAARLGHLDEWELPDRPGRYAGG